LQFTAHLADMWHASKDFHKWFTGRALTFSPIYVVRPAKAGVFS
jgi:hypothetical protein